MGVDDQSQAPVALPPGKTRYPLYRRLCGTEDRTGQSGLFTVRKCNTVVIVPLFEGSKFSGIFFDNFGLLLVITLCVLGFECN